MPTASQWVLVMAKWWLVLTVAMGSAIASAQPGSSVPPSVPSQAVAGTESAEIAAKVAERRVAQLAAQQDVIAKRWQDELEAVDRLKKQRASWRRDRELRDSLSTSLDTANRLSATTKDLEVARARLVNARRSYLTAIEDELGAGPVPLRRTALERAKRALASQLSSAPHRIVLPDLGVDLLADPEELDQRAAELRASEDELSREAIGLAAQAQVLEHLAQLRKQHERAGDLVNRDDDQPHRNTPRKTTDGTDEVAAGSWGDNPHSPSSPPGPSLPGGENYVPIVLADVIDASTISTFAAAERSGDPAQRAVAARAAHDAVARRIDQVRRLRGDIELRAKKLRAAH